MAKKDRTNDPTATDVTAPDMGSTHTEATSGNPPVETPNVVTEEAPPPVKKKKVESKSRRFQRLATRRVNKCILAIGKVKNLANAGNYEYTPDQAKAVVSALANAVAACEDAFRGNMKTEAGFTLPGM